MQCLLKVLTLKGRKYQTELRLSDIYNREHAHKGINADSDSSALLSNVCNKTQTELSCL